MWGKLKRAWANFPYKVSRTDIIAIIVTEVLTMIDVHFNGLFFMFNIGPMVFSISHLWIMVLGAVFGYTGVCYAILTVYVYYCIHDFGLAYISFVFLVAGLMGYQFSRRGLFRRPKLFPVAVAAICLVLGNGWYLLNCLLSPLGFSQVTVLGQVMLFTYCLPEALLFVLGCYVFFEKAPESIRDRVYCGYFYSPAYRENSTVADGTKRSRLGTAMTLGLILDMVIVVSGVIFMSAMTMDSFARREAELRGEPQQAEREVDFLGSFEYMEILGGQQIETGEIVGGNRFGEFANLRALLLELMMMLLCVSVPVILVTYHAFRTLMVRPLEQMAEYIKSYVNAKEDEKINFVGSMPRVEILSKNEIWEIREAMTTMINDTAAYITNLAKESELEKALAVEKEASRAKTAFLSNMSHEIRTPINSILGMNEMILRESQEGVIRSYASDIKSSGETLLRIVNDVLDLSRIEAGKLTIVPQQYDFSSTVNNLINIGDVQAEDKGLKLEININPMIPSVLFGDEKRIVQCVMNIMSNAFKYTQEGKVSLSIDYAPENSDTVAIRFSVTDTGIGIRPEDMERLFKPYDRIDEYRYHSIEGTGLGMDIVRQLLAMMNSHLTVHSVYGEGSSFSFAVFQKVLQWEPIGDVLTRYQASKGLPYQYRESFQAPNARILVVDDTNMNLVVIRGLLKQTRITIDTAESGADALRLVKKEHYHIIFIDHRMPVMDGIETRKRMAEMEDNLNHNVPCIALTANAVQGAREMYLGEGFQDYLAKPISVQRLENMIMKYLPQNLVVTPDNPLFDQNQIVESERIEGFSEDDIKEFTIKNHSEDLERYVAEGDIRNFTIAVHALKSNSRLIGAMKLSSTASDMEEHGNAGEMDKIREKLPQLLSLYRSYEDKLEPFNRHRLPDRSKLKPISEEEFLGALRDMRELISVFDYDNALSIQHMLEEYWIPEKYFKKWMRVRELMTEVDLEGLLHELE